MYGLPPDFNGDFFKGVVLQEVYYCQNVLFLRFDGDVRLSIESAFSHSLAGSEEEVYVQEFPLFESHLMRLLGKSVTEVHHDRRGTLKLVFDNGDVLRCYDPTPVFEAYTIHHGGEDLVV